MFVLWPGNRLRKLLSHQPRAFLQKQPWTVTEKKAGLRGKSQEPRWWRQELQKTRNQSIISREQDCGLSKEASHPRWRAWQHFYPAGLQDYYGLVASLLQTGVFIAILLSYYAILVSPLYGGCVGDRAFGFVFCLCLFVFGSLGLQIKKCYMWILRRLQDPRF